MSILKCKFMYSIALGVLCTLMVGCSSTDSNNVKYYSLDATITDDSLINQYDKELIIGIKQISLPQVLNTQSIVFYVSEHEIVQTENNKWISSLGDQINLSLTSQIKKHGIYSFIGKCSESEVYNCAELAIFLRDFSANYNGQVMVAFDWQYMFAGKLYRGSVHTLEKINEEGYTAVVTALKKAWTKSVSDMINEIRTVK